MHRDWVLSLKSQCRRAKVPLFFKQWGAVQKSKTGRTLNGRTYDAMPKRRGGVAVGGRRPQPAPREDYPFGKLSPLPAVVRGDR